MTEHIDFRTVDLNGRLEADRLWLGFICLFARLVRHACMVAAGLCWILRRWLIRVELRHHVWRWQVLLHLIVLHSHKYLRFLAKSTLHLWGLRSPSISKPHALLHHLIHRCSEACLVFSFLEKFQHTWHIGVVLRLQYAVSLAAEMVVRFDRGEILRVSRLFADWFFLHTMGHVHFAGLHKRLQGVPVDRILAFLQFLVEKRMFISQKSFDWIELIVFNCSIESHIDRFFVKIKSQNLLDLILRGRRTLRHADLWSDCLIVLKLLVNFCQVRAFV